MSAATVADLGEHALIARLRARASAKPRPWITVGIGDDAAVVEPERGASVVLTTDSLVEGVHFRRDWTPARAVGHKALAVSLSDLAAMGATPRASLLSLALPATLPAQDFDELIEGFIALADASGAPLVGGNLTRTAGPLVADSTVVGSVHPRKILRRSGGRPGDELYVTGTLGAAAAGLAMLVAGTARATVSAEETECIERYERPQPRLRCGRAMARARAVSAGIDLSDGLADAARQLADASGVGVVVSADAIPVDPGVRTWSARHGLDAVDLAVKGGEDYELLLAVRPRSRRAFQAASRHCSRLEMTLIGRLTAEPGAWLERDGARQPLGPGFRHF